MLVKFALIALATANRMSDRHEQQLELEVDASANFTDETTEADIDELVAGGDCTVADKAAMYKLGPGGAKTGMPGAIDGCANGALTWTLSLDENKFKTCIRKKLGGSLTPNCAKCLTIGPKYGITNCKSACMSGSCKQSCLRCTTPVGPKIAACTGFPLPAQTCGNQR